MSIQKLAGLEPAAVFGYFEEICAIAHGSGNTKMISDYLVRFAQQHGIRYVQDELNNVVMFQEGTCGYEDHAPVILQGHMDMVCEKDADCPIDMEMQGLDIDHDGQCVFAHGTTLGGDNGIAVAYVLALLSDKSIPHPPLEIILTVDEETGMEGAAGVDLSQLQGRTMINLDSEDEGIFTVSCAGGARATMTLPVEFVPVSGRAIRLVVDGLQGGHSGVEIHKNRISANKVMANLLLRLVRMPYGIAAINGGSKDNAIARSCQAVLVMENDDIETIQKTAAQLLEELKDCYDEPDMVIQVESLDSIPEKALDRSQTRSVIALLINVPSGVIQWLDYESQMVRTSLNMGIVRLEEHEFRITFSVRSCVNQEKRELLDRLRSRAEQYGAHFHESGDYPAWEYKEESALREIMVAKYAQMFGVQPQVVAIHAGLECGLLSEKLPGLDCVSIGPNMHDIHTSREKLEIESTRRTWEYLLEVLKAL